MSVPAEEDTDQRWPDRLSLADAETASASIAVSMKGVAGASSTSTSKADAIAIDASEGNDIDTVVNNGAC